MQNRVTSFMDGRDPCITNHFITIKQASKLYILMWRRPEKSNISSKACKVWNSTGTFQPPLHARCLDLVREILIFPNLTTSEKDLFLPDTSWRIIGWLSVVRNRFRLKYWFFFINSPLIISSSNTSNRSKNNLR